MVRLPFSTVPYVSLDVETYGLNWLLPEEGIFGISFCYPNGESHYIDIRESPEDLEWLKKQVPNKVVNHNIKFDLHMLHTLGVNWEPSICDCTMIRANIINEHELNYSLDNLASKYLGENKQNDIYDKLFSLFGGKATRKVQIKNLHKAPSSLVGEYARKDAFLALRLWEYQEKEIESQGLHKIAKLERDLFPVVFDMERQGVKVNVELANQAVAKLTTIIEDTQAELDNIAGYPFNTASPKHMVSLFKPELSETGDWLISGIPIEKTPKGKPKLNIDTLNLINTRESELVLKIRKYMKCRDTFLKGHILSHVSPDGYLHPTINQVKGDFGGTSTGRFSITKPALQQIPARDKEIASIMRPIFVADKGHTWACWDYSQFEFRVFSHYVNDPKIIKLYQDNPKIDYHQMVADLTGLPRNASKSGGANAKQLNLAMIYDMGGASIAKLLNMPSFVTDSIIVEDSVREDKKLPGGPFYKIKKETNTTYITVEGCEILKTDCRKFIKAGEEASNIIEQYHEAIPGVQSLAKKVRSVVTQRGFVWSIMGRKMRCLNKKMSHKMKAKLCQGSSADCMKQKMIEVYWFFKKNYPTCRIYFTVHDELNIGIDLKIPDVSDILDKITGILENYDGKACPIFLRVPITTDLGIGNNWAKASGKGS